MQFDVILDFPDGHIEEAILARPFNPEDRAAHVLSGDGDGTKVIPLSELCCVLMQKNGFSVPGAEHSLEVITVTSDKHYHVAIPNGQQVKAGFYGVANETDSPYNLIFFTYSGVSSREDLAPIGKMLEENNFVTSFEIEKVLEEQKALRQKKLGAIIAEEQGVPQRNIENAIDTAYREGRISESMKIGDILVEAGLVTKDQVETAFASQVKGRKKRIGDLLVEKGLITEEQLVRTLAVKFHIPFVDLEKITPSQPALDLLPADMVHKLRIFPVEDNGERITIATSEPTDLTVYDTLRFYFHGKRYVDLVVAVPRQISAAILKHYQKDAYVIEDIISDMTETVLYDDSPAKEAGTISDSDSQVVALVNRILIDGHGKDASDIHFEPGGRGQPVEVRYRIDGTCRLVHKIPRSHKNAIISRIKIMANLDFSEKRKPQSGKIVLWNAGRQIEYRVETTPTIGGNEDAVLRILPHSDPLPLSRMDFSASNLEIMKGMLSQPYGLILCVGPTGSGKTTMLHGALKHLNKPEVKIWTIEDPVEITQKGLRQVQAAPKIGLTFSEALRSFLRSDPDIIMVGEMRDPETAKTAIDASLTGHLVLSTLHTNSAPETLVRLVQMGLDPVNFADSILGVLAQRLARRVCNKCGTSYHPDRSEYDRLVDLCGKAGFEQHINVPYSPALSFRKAVGCEACSGTGYKGRIAVHELLEGTTQIKDLIRRNAGLDELKALAIKQGMTTLLIDGVQKVINGSTDLPEIMRVCRYERTGN